MNQAKKLKTLSIIIELYKAATKIKWVDNQSTTILEGKILKDKDIIPFKYDTTNNSPYQITNSIWELLE